MARLVIAWLWCLGWFMVWQDWPGAKMAWRCGRVVGWVHTQSGGCVRDLACSANDEFLRARREILAEDGLAALASAKSDRVK